MARPTTTGSRSQRKTVCDCGNVVYKTPAQLRERGTDYCGHCYDTFGEMKRMTCAVASDYALTPQGQAEAVFDYLAAEAKADDKYLLAERRRLYPQLRCAASGCGKVQTTEHSEFVMRSYEAENGGAAFDGDLIRVRGEGVSGFRFQDGSSRYAGCEHCGGDSLRPMPTGAGVKRARKAEKLAEVKSCAF